jgi:hypothetical protein
VIARVWRSWTSRYLIERERTVGHHEVVHEDPSLGDQPD